MPRMEPDFDWTNVQATTPIYPKGDYELTVKSIRGQAWPKRDDNGNPTGDVTKVIRLRPVLVGIYDSKGKLAFVHQGGYSSEADLAQDITRYAR
jgi:hypothetical protein